MAKPDYTGIKPIAAVSEIIPGLFQGVRPASYVGYDLVVSCEEFLAKKPMEGYRGMTIHIPFLDDDNLPIPEQHIEAVAYLVASAIRGGKQALVHCSGGLNRSSLVTVRVLESLGDTPQEAVGRLRTARDDFCLCNRAFERWALREALPTAETSAFRDMP